MFPGIVIRRYIVIKTTVIHVATVSSINTVRRVVIIGCITNTVGAVIEGPIGRAMEPTDVSGTGVETVLRLVQESKVGRSSTGIVAAGEVLGVFPRLTRFTLLEKKKIV